MEEKYSIQEVATEIEGQYQEMCHAARMGGAATIDEVANALSSMCKLASIVGEISKKVSPQD